APETFEKGIAHYRRYYEAHRYDHTDLYPGVPEMLDGLVEAGLTIAVLSNKPHDATLEMVHRLMKKWPFAIVQGHEEGGPLKPDPAAAKRIAEGLEIPLEHWAYVGETKVDTTTAVNAGMFGVGVTWGFREESELREHGADAIIHHPAELLDAIEAAEPAK
ncbi:MAG: HAD family hydrolase, partial [Phycisphaeraceae bacterium]